MLMLTDRPSSHILTDPSALCYKQNTVNWFHTFSLFRGFSKLSVFDSRGPPPREVGVQSASKIKSMFAGLVVERHSFNRVSQGGDPSGENWPDVCLADRHQSDPCRAPQTSHIAIRPYQNKVVQVVREAEL